MYLHIPQSGLHVCCIARTARSTLQCNVMTTAVCHHNTNTMQQVVPRAAALRLRRPPTVANGMLLAFRAHVRLILLSPRTKVDEQVQYFQNTTR